jgi:hypothetical protein
MGDWTFFSNYGHVLVCLARNREARLRDVAAEVGITERAVQKIVRDLQSEGFLTISKQGRCNRYRINRRKSLRHELEGHCTVGKLLALVSRAAPLEATTKESGDSPQPEAPRDPSEAPAVEVVEVKVAGPKKAGGKPAPPDTREQGSLF